MGTGVRVYHFTNTGIRVRRHRYTSSQTPGDEFPYKMYGQYTISQTPVYEFADTGIRVRRHRYTSSRHRYTSSQTPVYEFADTGRRVPTQNVWAVYDFANTGI